MNFNLIYFYYGTMVATSADFDRYFFRRPLNQLTVSGRRWVNGIFDAANTSSNVLYEKMDNTFDASGRLTKAVVYYNGSNSLVTYIFKIYYD
jgi:hypothetical protein